MLFYFTATGNSLYVAKRLDPRCISIAQAIHDDPQPYQDAQIGIVCPVHAQQIPELVSTFLHDAHFDTPYFYMILTYGSHYGKAPQQAFELALRLGINPAYINAVMMADSFLPAADIEKEMATDKHISAQIDAIRTDLNARRRFILPLDAQDEPERCIQPDAKRTMFVISEDCIGCGICRKICPMDRFTIQAQKSQYDPKGCIACMACIHACPMNAIQLTIPEKTRNARYRNAHITLCELIEANDQHPYKKDMHDEEEKR